MRNILIAIFMLTSVCLAYGQSVDYNKIILPEDEASISFEEKLVRLAWKNYPINETYYRQIKISHKQVHLARWSWTDNFRVFYNLNDKTIANDGTNAGGIPTVGLGVGVNLGSFISVPGKVKIAKEQEKISEAELKAQKLKIRAEVLQRYNTYKLNQELLKMRAQALEDAHSTYLLITKRFQSGEATLEEYNGMSLSYNNAQEAKLVAENNLATAKILLEEMIGVRVEEVM